MIGKKKNKEQLTYEEMEKLAKADKSVCKSGGKTYKVGQSWKEKGTCEVKVCHPGGIISVMPCPRFIYDKKKMAGNCQEVAEDVSQDYPECCAYVYCKPQTTEKTSKGLG